MATKTNQDSAFTPFSLTLANGAELTGISHIPPGAPKSASSKPLLVALHGGTCTAQNYDASPEYTASTTSAALGIPFVAINRPCYGETTSFLPLSESTSFYGETANWMHNFILPLLWETFGKPNNCTAIVTTSHSMAVPPTIVTAVMYTEQSPDERKYPLAGIILSGFGGDTVSERDFSRVEFKDGMLKYPIDIKWLMMGSDESLKCADPALYPLLEKQDVVMPIEEVNGLHAWPNNWTEHVAKVGIPVMYGMGEHDWLWDANQKNIAAFEKAFTSCPRFDGSLVLGAPHALEWAYVSKGWYARCFGWAMEVCAPLAHK